MFFTDGSFDWSSRREFVVAITPQLARKWLDERNKLNRKLNPFTVAQLTRAIGEGRWQYTGESISFDKNGILSNGQHRLAAIAAGSVSCESLVVFGLEPTARWVQDTGTARRTSQTVSMATDIPGPATQTEWLQTTLRLFISAHEKAAPQDVIQRYALDKDNIDWLLARRKIGRGRLYTASVFSVFLLAMRIDQRAVRRFVDRYCSGTGLSVSDPEYMLRESMINDRTGGGDAQRSQAERAAAAVFAAIEGRQLRRLVRSEAALMKLRGLAISLPGARETAGRTRTEASERR